MIAPAEAAPAAASTDPIQHELIAALRTELQELGGLHALLEREAPAEESLRQQNLKLRFARKRRETLARALAEAEQCETQPTIRAIAGLFRPGVRPMVQALAGEVTRLTNLARRRSPSRA